MKNFISTIQASTIVFAFFFTPTIQASAERDVGIPSDIKGINFKVECLKGEPQSDYVAETFDGAAGTKYSKERGADKGLVKNLNSKKWQKAYSIPKEKIRAILKIKYDMDVLDRMDLLVLDSELIYVHTSQSNAGVFAISVVLLLPKQNNILGYLQFIQTLKLTRAEFETEIPLLLSAISLAEKCSH